MRPVARSSRAGQQTQTLGGPPPGWDEPHSLHLADIDQLIAISGMVIRTSQLIPEMQEAFFQCQVCAHTARVEIDRGRIAEPCVCERCHTSHSMALIHNRSVFTDKQMVRAPSTFPVLVLPLPDPPKPSAACPLVQP